MTSHTAHTIYPQAASGRRLPGSNHCVCVPSRLAIPAQRPRLLRQARQEGPRPCIVWRGGPSAIHRPDSRCSPHWARGSAADFKNRRGGFIGCTSGECPHHGPVMPPVEACLSAPPARAYAGHDPRDSAWRHSTTEPPLTRNVNEIPVACDRDLHVRSDGRRRNDAVVRLPHHRRHSRPRTSSTLSSNRPNVLVGPHTTTRLSACGGRHRRQAGPAAPRHRARQPPELAEGQRVRPGSGDASAPPPRGLGSKAVPPTPGSLLSRALHRDSLDRPSPPKVI